MINIIQYSFHGERYASILSSLINQRLFATLPSSYTGNQSLYSLPSDYEVNQPWSWQFQIWRQRFLPFEPVSSLILPRHVSAVATRKLVAGKLLVL